jgi:hypothetical protein
MVMVMIEGLNGRRKEDEENDGQDATAKHARDIASVVPRRSGSIAPNSGGESIAVHSRG